MKLKILALIIFFSFESLSFAIQTMGYFNGRILKNEMEYFSIQVASFPLSEKEQSLQLYKKLKDQGYFVFLTKFRPRSKSQAFIRVRIGRFHKYKDAKKFSIKLQREGFECFINNQKFIIDAKGNRTVIKTPSGIWLYENNSYRELYTIIPSLFDQNIDSYYTQPFISPKGDKVSFEYDGKIIVINIDNNKQLVFKGHIANSFPQISPSGDYIAYINDNLWESWSSLWVIKNDRSKTCLVDVMKMSGENAVKNFRWHPQKDIIFFVMGFATGTVTVGGSIYAVDMNGNKCLLISANKKNREEIADEFYISNNLLYYKVAQYDEGYMKISKLTKKKKSIALLLSKFYSKIEK